ncbi:MAG TPA: hypothetical protein VNY05_38660 [Candidatus Acidoferrales bacterium]|jgi:hypothetical protein|nr:hypothetical protein [Candidatus Acidoferrales bacterium]
MKAASKDTPAGTSKDALAGASPTDAAELLVAEIRECRQRLQQLIRLVSEELSQEVSEEAGRDLPAMDAPRAQRPLPRHRCRRASTIRGSRRQKRARRGMKSGA